MEITRKEFDEMVKENNYEFYTAKEVNSFCRDIAKSVDPIEREHAAIDFASLSQVTVRENNLSKSIMFYRPASVEWREVDETDSGSLMKSRTGYYRDTPANRRKGIVGKPYGDPKADQYEEAPRANTIARLKQDYARASKTGDKVKMAKIGEQLKLLAAKEKGASEKEKKED